MLNKTNKATRNVAPTRPIGVGCGKEQLSVIILDTIIDQRIKSYGPKPLLLMRNGQSILNYQISQIHTAYPKCEIILATTYDKKLYQCKPNNCRIVENKDIDVGETEFIRLGLNNICNNNVMIIDSGLLFLSNHIKDLTKHTASTLFCSQQVGEIGATINDNMVCHMSYAIASPSWCHLLYIGPNYFVTFYNLVHNEEKKRQFLFELVNNMIDKETKIYGHVVNGKILRVDSSNTIEEMVQYNQ